MEYAAQRSALGQVRDLPPGPPLPGTMPAPADSLTRPAPAPRPARDSVQVVRMLEPHELESGLVVLGRGQRYAVGPRLARSLLERGKAVPAPGDAGPELAALRTGGPTYRGEPCRRLS